MAIIGLPAANFHWTLDQPDLSPLPCGGPRLMVLTGPFPRKVILFFSVHILIHKGLCLSGDTAPLPGCGHSSTQGHAKPTHVPAGSSLGGHLFCFCAVPMGEKGSDLLVVGLLQINHGPPLQICPQRPSPAISPFSAIRLHKLAYLSFTMTTLTLARRQHT